MRLARAPQSLRRHAAARCLLTRRAWGGCGDGGAGQPTRGSSGSAPPRCSTSAARVRHPPRRYTTRQLQRTANGSPSPRVSSALGFPAAGPWPRYCSTGPAHALPRRAAHGPSISTVAFDFQSRRSASARATSHGDAVRCPAARPSPNRMTGNAGRRTRRQRAGPADAAVRLEARRRPAQRPGPHTLGPAVRPGPVGQSRPGTTRHGDVSIARGA